MIKNKRYKALFAFICALGWSMAYPLIKVGYNTFQIMSDDLGGKTLFAGVRFLFAGIIIICFCMFRKKNTDLKRKTDISWLVLLAIVNTTLHYMFAYIGLGNNPSGRSTILDSMGGFFLIFLSVIFFEDDRLSTRKVIGCIMGLSGIILININPGGNSFENITFSGDGMILLNALCAGFGGVITRVVSRKMNMISATGYSMAIGGAFLIAIGCGVGTTSRWKITGEGIIVLFALVMISAVCFAIYNELLSVHPISEIAIYNALIPVLGVFFAALVLNEELKWQYFAAVLLVAAGICIESK